MKRAEAGGVTSTFEVGEDYKRQIAALPHAHLVKALVDEAELRGAWQQCAEVLARREPDAGVVFDEVHVMAPERLERLRARP